MKCTQTGAGARAAPAHPQPPEPASPDGTLWLFQEGASLGAFTPCCYLPEACRTWDDPEQVYSEANPMHLTKGTCGWKRAGAGLSAAA